jgi:peptidoglycan/xylan/chitin deacetylase (PgdA/CDA1 family)
MGVTTFLAKWIGPFGGFWVVNQFTLSYPRILMYHRFSLTPSPGAVSEKTFEKQVRYLQKHCELVSLSSALDRTRLKRGPGSKPLAVITIDDGYSDFYDVAYPILKKLEAPATFYVTTSFVDGDVWLWHDRLQWCLDHAGIPSKPISLEGREVRPSE